MGKRFEFTAAFDLPDDAIDQGDILTKLKEPRDAFKKAVEAAVPAAQKKTVEVKSGIVTSRIRAPKAPKAPAAPAASVSEIKDAA